MHVFYIFLICLLQEGNATVWNCIINFKMIFLRLINDTLSLYFLIFALDINIEVQSQINIPDDHGTTALWLFRAWQLYLSPQKKITEPEYPTVQFLQKNTWTLRGCLTSYPVFCWSWYCKSLSVFYIMLYFYHFSFYINDVYGIIFCWQDC